MGETIARFYMVAMLVLLMFYSETLKSYYQGFKLLFICKIPQLQFQLRKHLERRQHCHARKMMLSKNRQTY